jgi:hypothetical protein
MNRERGWILLGAVILALGLALPGATSRPVEAASRQSPQADFAAPVFDLECGAKAPAGLAQCGSQASSCKNCHEVKGEDPVNAQGDWHTQHAFGDFCEFCHGGNVQALDQNAAHQGLVAPLGDIQTNCASCHDAFEPKAQTYAAALGVTIGAGDSNPPSQPAAPSEPAPTPQPAPAAAALPSGGEIVDYVAQHASGGAPSISAGNLVVGILLALTVAGGGAFVYWNEKRLRRADRRSQIAGQATPVSEVVSPESERPGDLPPELAKLLPALRTLDPRTLRALRIILSDRKRGEELLQSLSLINFAVLDEMKRLDKKELSLLLALAGES